MAQAAPASLLDRANVAFRIATSQPTEGRMLAERVAGEAAVSTAREAPEAQAVALRGASWAARELFDHDAARSFIDQAVAIADQHSLQQRLGECLLTSSSIHLERGQERQARADLARAAAIAPPEIGAEVAVSLGIIEQKAGRYAEAIESYRTALEFSSDGQDDVRFKAFSNGALCASRLSRHAEAAAMIDAAIDVAKRSSAVYVAHAAHNRAVLTAERGNPTRALHYFDEALELWNAADLVPAEHYLEKAETLLALRLLDEADAAVNDALEALTGRDGAVLLLAEGLLLAAAVAGERGHTDRAIELNERAASIFSAQGRSGWWAVAAHAAIATRLSAGDATPDGRRRLRRVESELARAGHISGQIDTALTSARLARRLGDTRAAARAYTKCAELSTRQAALQRLQGWVAATESADMYRNGRGVSSAARAGLKTLDDYRATFDAIELRARAVSYGEAMAQTGLRWAAATGRPEHVWFWLERTRAAALIEPGRPDTDEQAQAALGRLRAAATRVAELEPGDVAGPAAQRDLARAENALRAVAWKRERPSQARAAVAVPTLGQSPTHATLERLRTDLGPVGLVQYGVADGQVIAVTVTPSRRAFIPLGSHDDIAAATRQLAFALRRLGRSRNGGEVSAVTDLADAALDRLDRLLVSRRLRAEVDGCEQLVVVPPSDMIGIPWASFPTFSSRDLTVAPSATAWWVTAMGRQAVTGRTVAFAGPNLDHAADEAREVAAAYPDGAAFVNEAATSTAFAEQVDGAGTVHVAAHGHLRSDSPTFSSFQLADGPFTVHDIQRVPTPPRRWVLAACDLGSPGHLSGQDLEGIVAALLGGGAGAVVAAVLPVPDTSTPKLMVALHARLAEGVPMAQALREARRELDPHHPLDRLTQVAFTCFGAG